MHPLITNTNDNREIHQHTAKHTNI